MGDDRERSGKRKRGQNGGNPPQRALHALPLKPERTADTKVGRLPRPLGRSGSRRPGTSVRPTIQLSTRRRSESAEDAVKYGSFLLQPVLLHPSARTALMKKPVRVAVTGAAGQIGYSLLFRIASGEMLGRDQ